MRKLLITIMVAMMTIGNVQAQIPADVAEIMRKCDETMSSPNGVELTMEMKTSFAFVTLTNVNMVMGSKDDKFKVLMSFSMLGKEVAVESGFDGTNTWEIKHSTKGDTIIFTRGNTIAESEGALDLDLDKQYHKAKMKNKDGYYEITFSDPKDKTSEIKRISVKISEKNYAMREIRSGARGAKVTMTITKIRVGLKDSHFKLDLTKHPDAVVIRK